MKYYLYMDLIFPLMEKIRDINIYKMLSDEIRLKIMKELSEKDMPVSDIVNAFDVEQPLISHKLKELRENGMVISRRSGKNVIYSISDELLNNVLHITENAGDKLDYTCNCVECDNDNK
jgi:Predicted transcriptional regulators